MLHFPRHLQRNHSNEIEVVEFLSKPLKSLERMKLLAKLRKKGNYLINTISCKRPMKKSVLPQTNYLPCSYCFGYYSAKLLWRHRKSCNKNASSHHQSDGQTVLSNNRNVDAELKEKVFPRMRADKVSLIAKSDVLICAFGARYMKTHREKHFLNVTSRKMRELAKLLIELKKQDNSIQCFFDALQPRYFDYFVVAAKILGKYDEITEEFMSPTFAKNIATSIKQCCDIAILFSLKKKDYYNTIQTSEAEASLRTLKELFAAHWKFDVSSTACNNLNMRKWNKVTIVPLASDLKKFKNHLLTIAQSASQKLIKNNLNKLAYCKLLETVYCRVLLLNRRRPGELQRLPLHLYEQSEIRETNYEEFDDAISPLEKILLKKFKRIVIRGKRGRGVPVLFSDEIQSDIAILLKYRPNFLNKNPYLFGMPDTISTIYGCKVLKKYANQCGARNPDAITSTRLRKHLATLTQVFNLSTNEIEQLATFMGHTIGVHTNNYRLPDDIFQTAKIAKILLLMEKGGAAAYKGKGLDEININLEENLLQEVDNEDDDILQEIDDLKLPTEIPVQIEEPEIQLPSTSSNTNLSKPKRRILIPWTTEQKRIVEHCFRNHITYNKPPKRAECELLIGQHKELLKNKDWLKIKVYIQNQYKKKKVIIDN